MFQAETKICQNCKKEFTIEPEDFEFCAKIKVPPPTWCPECRLMRKMARRNERTLYKRQCDFCGQDIISMYLADSPFKIYCNSCWWSDKYDPLSYGRHYNFSKSFLQQFHELSKEVPRLALYQKNAINSPYTNHCDHHKNCFLTFDTGFAEEIMYSKWIVKSRDLLDCYGVFNSELGYALQDSEKCSRSIYSFYSNDCFYSAFLYNCRGCSYCFLSSNLRNKSYYFANQPFSKEEYQKKMKEIDLGSFKVLEKIKKRFFNEILPATIRRYAVFNKVVNSTGDNLYECKNLKQCFHVYESEDSAFCVDAANLKDCYDTYEPAFTPCERQYECHACNRVSNSIAASISYDNHHLQYSEMCHNSSYLLGCVGLRHKQYCILNKQYTKEEYEKLVPKIIQHMNSMPYIDKKGRVYKYGEFFPPELSPFAYNETIAQEYFPLTKEEAIKQGFKWKDPEEKDYKPDIKTEQLPDHIKDVDDSIIGKIIQCAHAKLKEDGTLEATCNEQCTTAFKIIEPELQFYRRMNLPLPRFCPNCRHYQRLKQRNPLKLWHRKCMCQGPTSANGVYKNTIKHFHGDNPCPNEFETTYGPDRPEIVYCEECYLREVV